MINIVNFIIIHFYYNSNKRGNYINMLIDNTKQAGQKQNNIFSYTMAGMILSYLQESNIPEDNGCDNMLIDGIKIEKQIEIRKIGNARQCYD